MSDEIGEIRRSQMVQIHGPGSIVNLKIGDASISALMCELGVWEKTANKEKTFYQKFHDERLTRSIESKYNRKVEWFKLPPIEPDPKNPWERKKSYLLGNIFPKTFICPKCRRVGIMGEDNWIRRRDDGDTRRICRTCTGHNTRNPTYLVPSRFIVACDAGHLQEFPYRLWLNAKGKGGSEDCKHSCMDLKQNKGLGLASLILRCKDDETRELKGCGRWARMNGIFVEGGLPIGCEGESPWLMDYKTHKEECKLIPKALQRNSVAVWQGVTESALTIPPWDNKIKNLLSINDYWKKIIRRSDKEERERFIRDMYGDIKLDLEDDGKTLIYSLEELISNVHEEIENDSQASEELKVDEYHALTNFNEHLKIDDFQVRAEKISNDKKIRKLVSSVLAVERLREVRALVKFTRMKKNESKEVILVDLTRNDNIKWLPVIEVFGEGIFIELNQTLMDEFLSSSDLKKSINHLYDNPLKEQVVKRIILHTLSHLLMKSVAIDSGYSLASIGERIYDGEDQYGILIYTSTNDSEGTLGGLSRLAKKERLESIILQALEYSILCSNDPLCFDGALSAHDPTNGAACHSCLLVPETSCEDYNSNLSRTVIEALYRRL